MIDAPRIYRDAPARRRYRSHSQPRRSSTSALHLSAYALTLIGKYMCYAMLAIAVDLIWGYCGILSLGHAAFFSLGGYAMGMYLMRQIGPRGVYGDPVLPDFMVFLNWKELPWFWYGFNHFFIAMLMMVVVPALLAGVFGWFAFRSRVTGVTFPSSRRRSAMPSCLRSFATTWVLAATTGSRTSKKFLVLISTPTARGSVS
jgi:urea ABC transporter permease protein UrtC